MKTPHVGNSKNPRLSGKKMHLVSATPGGKLQRPTTAAGVSKYDTKELIPGKNRRNLGSAKPGQRRKLRGK